MICILDECVQLLQCVIQCSTELRQCIGNRHGGWTTSSFTDFFLFSVLLCSVLFMQYVLINLVSFLISFIFIRIRLFLFHIDMQLCGVSFVFLHLHNQHHHPGWFAFLFLFFSFWLFSVSRRLQCSWVTRTWGGWYENSRSLKTFFFCMRKFSVHSMQVRVRKS